MTLDIFEKFGLLPAISFLIGNLLFIIAILWLIRYLKIFYIQIKPYFQRNIISEEEIKEAKENSERTRRRIFG
jgi:hypothetical protein